MIDEGVAQAQSRTLYGIAFPVLPRLQTGLVLLMHMKQHMTEGIGLRHVLDFVMYAGSELDDDFWRSEFQAAAGRIGLDRLAMVTGRMAQIHLGLPEENHTWCMGEERALCDRLMEYVIDNGDFGLKLGKEKNVSKNMTRLGSIGGIFSRLQKDGCYNYRKAIEKYPFIKPFAWLLRLYRLAALGLRQKTGIGELREAYRVSVERGRLFEELGLTEKPDTACENW